MKIVTQTLKFRKCATSPYELRTFNLTINIRYEDTGKNFKWETKTIACCYAKTGKRFQKCYFRKHCSAKWENSLHANDADKPLIIVYETTHKKLFSFCLLLPESLFLSFLYLPRAFHKNVVSCRNLENIFLKQPRNDFVMEKNYTKSCFFFDLRLFLLFVFRLFWISRTEPRETQQFVLLKIISNGMKANNCFFNVISRLL